MLADRLDKDFHIGDAHRLVTSCMATQRSVLGRPGLAVGDVAGVVQGAKLPRTATSFGPTAKLMPRA
jgi:hypothetical protein